MLRGCVRRICLTSSPRTPVVFREAFSSCPKSCAGTSKQSGTRTQNPRLSRRWGRIVWPGVALVSAAVVGQQFYQRYDKSTSDFETFILLRKETVSPSASIFYLAASDGNGNLEAYRKAWRTGIWNFQFKQPQIQVVRSYTPLPPLTQEDEDSGKLRFLIRNERYGEVSNWLHRLPDGSQLELRGPNQEYEISPQTKHIIFLAGGTGIASALQAAHALLAQDSDADSPSTPNSAISILWANRRRDDCLGGVSSDPAMHRSDSGWFIRLLSSSPSPAPLPEAELGPMVKELETLKFKFPGCVIVDYFVDAERTYIDSTSITRAMSRSRPITSSDTAQDSADTQIIVSGPEGFISYLAGPRMWNRGREEQGPVSGIVHQALAKEQRRVKIWKV